MGIVCILYLIYYFPGIDCEGDIGPIPNPGSLPDKKFFVKEGNKTCIGFTGQINFNVPYLSKSGYAVGLTRFVLVMLIYTLLAHPNVSFFYQN